MTPDDDKLLADAANVVAELLEQGYGLALKGPERRLRSAVRAGLLAVNSLCEARREFRPKLPYWPNLPAARLGGFDLGLGLHPDATPRVVLELKWCNSWQKVWEIIWDCFKLAHAAALPGCDAAFACYAISARAWEKQGPCSELLTTRTSSTRDLFDEYEWLWADPGGQNSKARPTRMPAAVQTSVIAEAPFAQLDDPFESREAYNQAVA